jgi:hypothetical protein
MTSSRASQKEFVAAREPSACILTEGEFVGSTWLTYLGPYPGFQLLQPRQTFAAQVLPSLLLKHTLWAGQLGRYRFNSHVKRVRLIDS